MLAALVLPFQPGAVAHADSVTVKGTTLKGTITSIGSRGVEVKTEYGKGSLFVAYEDLEDIRTETPFHLYYAEKMAAGRIVGFENGMLLVSEEGGTAVPVDPKTLHQAYTDKAYNAYGLGFIRRNFALWRGAFDLGFSLTRAAADTTGLAIGFTADRLKRPSRVTTRVGYRYGTQQGRGDAEASTTENELKGSLRGEHDFRGRWYAFGSGDGEYDEIERLSFRGVPKGGVGRRFWESDSSLFQLEAGGAYTYEKYFGGDSNDYAGLVFGKLLEAGLPYGAVLRWQTDYLPAADNWAGDFLLRTEASLIVPMLSYLSLKLTLFDQYDSTPADNAVKNTLATAAGVSLVY